MAYELEIWTVVSVISLLSNIQPKAYAEPQVPCFFIFGDSVVDNGNNNGLGTTAKANYRPYGIDFPDGPTGRFGNGRNLADIIADHLGFDKYISPFATARGKDILAGVNYGSGGAGIRDETGAHSGELISMNKQLVNHQTTMRRIASFLGGKEAAADYLGKCLYVAEIGTDDYTNNYFLPQYYPTSSLYSLDQYTTVLIHQYSSQLRTLHKYGARKIAVFGSAPQGCAPAVKANFGLNGTSCVEIVNDALQQFNNKLISLVDDLNNNLSDSKFVYINMTEIASRNLSDYGVVVVNDPCCDVSTGVAKGQCVPNQVPCSNRSVYYYYDGFHPTEVVTAYEGTEAYYAMSQLFDVHSSLSEA